MRQKGKDDRPETDPRLKHTRPTYCATQPDHATLSFPAIVDLRLTYPYCVSFVLSRSCSRPPGGYYSPGLRPAAQATAAFDIRLQMKCRMFSLCPRPQPPGRSWPFFVSIATGPLTSWRLYEKRDFRGISDVFEATEHKQRNFSKSSRERADLRAGRSRRFKSARVS